MKKSDQEFWQEQIQRQQNSGLSIKKYCVKEGLILSKFYHFKKKLGQAPTKTDFLSLEERAQKVLSIELDNKLILSFESLPDPTWLGEVLGSIGHADRP